VAGRSASLMALLDGWDGYQLSLVRAVAPLTPAQLAFRPAPHLRTAGQIGAHVVVGRLAWFAQIEAPGALALAQEGAALGSEDAIACDAALLAHWLEASWRVVERALSGWTASDLAWTFRQDFEGVLYQVSRQWVLWRVLSHDLHHGGELALALGMQGIALPDLGERGGHIIVPPLAGATPPGA
jgi:uncharacterized damage-inducible protein DinB